MKKMSLAAFAIAAAVMQMGCSQFATRDVAEAPPTASNERVVPPSPTAPTAAADPASAPPPPPPQAKPAERPLFQTTRVEGTDKIYVFRYANAQAMFVVTSAGVIATDPISYAHRDASKTYLAEIRKITKQPVKYVIYSHHHFDHIAGGKPFKDAGAKFIAHRRAKERLAALKDPYTVVPDETVDKSRVIKLGNTTLELTYIGLNHSDSTLVMRLPKEKVVFAVDFIPVGSLSGVGWIDSYPIDWERSLKRLMAMDWKWLIPGHPGVPNGRLGTKEDVQKYIEFMHYASAEVKKAAHAGQCWEPTEKQLQFSRYTGVIGYELARPYIVRRYCGLWGRGT